MIILITGASHVGKTLCAQKLLEKYGYPYLSIDHLKMGLIRSGNTNLTPTSDDRELTEYLWPIVREMIKTAIENKQNLIVEGCYIPFDWKNDFDEKYLEEIKYYCLVMSENYIKNHFEDIKKYANAIEHRIDDDCTMDSVLEDNEKTLKLAREYGVNYVLIDGEYKIEIQVKRMKKIIVIGCPGSGKSTFSRELHDKTKIPLYHLDMLFWNADKTTVEKSVFLERLNELLDKDEWILDGNFNSTMELRMSRCDTVIFLDYPPDICLEGVRARRGKVRFDMPWIETEEDAEFMDYIRNFNEQRRPQIIALLEKFKDKNIVRFTSREEADAYLAKIV